MGAGVFPVSVLPVHTGRGGKRSVTFLVWAMLGFNYFLGLITASKIFRDKATLDEVKFLEACSIPKT